MVSCPGGPTTKTVWSFAFIGLQRLLIFEKYIGRVDATAAAPPNQLPAPNVTASEAKAHFLQAGFSSQDLAALIGAHTAARQFTVDPSKSGASEDSTPGIWVWLPQDSIM